MNDTWLRSILSGEEAKGTREEAKGTREEAKGTREAVKGDVISAPTLNITKFVSIFVLVFAAITQGLAWIGAITLSTTQQVTIWLIVAGLIVLLAIADMACRAYVTAKRYEASAARPRGGPKPQQVEPPAIPSDKPDGGRTLRPVPPPGDGNPGGGSRLDVDMADVFPHGCYLAREPDSISEAQDCDESIEARPVVDKFTRKPVFSCRVLDMDPDREGQLRETVVKVVAERMPVLPPPADGLPFAAIEFEGLTAAPPTISRGRAAYTSLRATGIRPIRPAQEAG